MTFTSDERRELERNGFTMSEVTKIHTVDGGVVTVDGNFLAELSHRPSVVMLQNFDNKILVNISNVTYMEAVSAND